MDDKRLVVGKIQIRAIDGLILAALAVISLLAILFSRRVEGWWLIVLKNLAAGAAYVALGSFSERITHKSWRFLVRMANIMLAFTYVNLAVDKLQLVLYGRWLDGLVLKFEDSLFGLQPTVWLQQFISKPLTEWLMFAYVIYLPMFLTLCGLVYHRAGERAAEDCFFTLGLSNILCDLSFMLFPVAGPIAYMGSKYTVPLEGYVWTWLGEALRHHAQFVGGSIPSPHCANVTVMLLLAYRYHRPAFWILSPIVLSVYVSTVYCRFHYVTDSVLGVAAAFLIFAATPAFMKGWIRIVESIDKRIR